MQHREVLARGEDGAARPGETHVLYQKNLFVAASIAVVVLVSSAPAPFAATASGTLTISASVVTACTEVGSAIVFGAYTQTVVNQTGTITVLCTNGTAYNIGLDAGTGTGASVSNRKMSAAGGGTLNYVLYRDSARSNSWGSTIGTDTLTGIGSGLTQTLTY